MSVRKSGRRAVSLKSFALPEAIRPAQCWSLGSQSPTRSGRLKARTCWRMNSGWKSGLDSSAICWATAYVATGKNQAYSCLGPSGARLHQALDRTANRPGSPWPRGQEGARRSNTQAHSDPLRTGTVRGPEHRTSNIQHPISKGGAKPPKATPKPHQCDIRPTTKPYTWEYRGTSKPTDSQPIGTPKPHQCDPKATLRLHQGSTKATFGGGRHCQDGGGNLDTYPVGQTC